MAVAIQWEEIVANSIITGNNKEVVKRVEKLVGLPVMTFDWENESV